MKAMDRLNAMAAMALAMNEHPQHATESSGRTSKIRLGPRAECERKTPKGKRKRKAKKKAQQRNRK